MVKGGDNFYDFGGVHDVMRCRESLGGGVWNVGMSMLEENFEATMLVFCSVILWISSLVALSL